MTPSSFAVSACRICGSSSLGRRFGDVLPWVAECGECGIVFADPQPSDEELASIYDEHYYEQFGFLEDPSRRDNRGIETIKRATYDSMLRVAEPYVATENRAMIDVGCGLGFSLLAAEARGWTALGLDPLGQDRPGRRIERGTLADYKTDRAFGLVSMIDVIEHVRDPEAEIRHAASLLDEGGVLMLATNDISSRGARVLGPRWTHLHRAHLWFFTPATLTRVAEKAGLDVVAVADAKRVYNLQYIASILARGQNFGLARVLSKFALRAVPSVLRDQRWPGLSEGFVLVARRRA